MPEEMAVSEVLLKFIPGDEHSWETEFKWLRDNDPQNLASILLSVTEEGIHTPIMLGYDGRVWDGHHRIYVAVVLGMETIPVDRVPEPIV